jgi:FkbM family methyltransferase
MIRIAMPPAGHVFGVGWHKHTQTGLLAVDKYVKPGMSVVDFGAGTGILAVAAMKLGASRVYAVDIHPDALDVCRRTVQANHCDNVVTVTTIAPDDQVDIGLISVGSTNDRAFVSAVNARLYVLIRDEAVEEVVS